MGQIQELVYVQPYLPSATYQDGGLPARHDPLCMLGVCRDSCFGRYCEHSQPAHFIFQYILISMPFCIDYLDQQSEIQGQHPGVKVHNNDFIGAASYNIFAGISVAFIFGGAFFFDLFWPERHEDRGVKWAWKICAVVECLAMLGSALTMTVWHAVMLITRSSCHNN